MRDEERGTRELPAEGGHRLPCPSGADSLGDDGPGGSRRMADGIDGIPEQARPHPEQGAVDTTATGLLDDGQRDRKGAVQGAPPAGPAGVVPVRTEARARGRATGGTMSEHERNAEDGVAGANNTPVPRHDPQDRSGARALFVELRALKDGSPEYAELRNRLVRMHLPLVEHLARRFRNRGEPLDDLTQVATIGLIKSVDRFDPDRGVEFSTYATPTVVGEIKRHFRDKGWAVRVPRRLQELNLSLNKVVAELSQEIGRSPTVAEIATKARLPEEEVLEGLDTSNAYAVVSLDAPAGGEDAPAVSEHIGVEDESLEALEYRAALGPLIAGLPERERRILYLRFFGGMTQSQIAARLGISQMHVSRLLNRTLAVLREGLLQDEETG
ncbi:MAG: RNA polymerase sigma factor SigF [Actinomycetes bacterium]